MEQPLVTIIIQTYNRRHLVHYALESAKNQTYKNIEILIGDNHSQDSTEEYCLEQAKQDSRIRYFRHSENIGMVNNANFLLDRVEGKYFIWLNDDDWLDLTYVEKSVEFFEQHKDYAFVTPCRVLYNQKREKIKTGKPVYMEQENAWERIGNYYANMHEDMVSGLFRTDLVREMKQLSGRVFFTYYAEDLFFMMRYLVAGKAKMLENTYLNKLENGRTRGLEETPADIFDIKGVTRKNYYDVIYRNAAQCIDKEQFIWKYADKEAREKIKREAKDALMGIKYERRSKYLNKLKTCFRIAFSEN